MGNEIEQVSNDLSSFYVEGDSPEDTEREIQDTFRARQNWIALGNGGFYTAASRMSDFA